MTWTHTLLGLLVLLVFLHVVLIVKHARLEIRAANLERSLRLYEVAEEDREEKPR